MVVWGFAQAGESGAGGRRCVHCAGERGVVVVGRVGVVGVAA